SYFFFSSRRRHTRFSRDWSSDVCSSDLCFTGAVSQRPILKYCTISKNEQQKCKDWSRAVAQVYSLEYDIECFQSDGKDRCMQLRSEERRVGKECRSRWQR